MLPKTIAVLGAGSRGTMFGQLIARSPQQARLVAVAEPREPYRQAFAREHQISDNGVFATWQEFVDRPRVCDAVILSMMDRDHAAAALACLARGYDILLEKPMGCTLAECRAIEQAQRQAGVILGVCHSLRYHHGFRKVTAQKATAAAFAELRMADEIMSIYRPNSQVAILNRQGTLDRPHPYLLEILRSAIAWSERSDGAFDPTVQPLWQIYAAAKKLDKLPEGQAITASLTKINWRMLDISPSRITLRNPGMAITLNGIAQGYAADRATAALRAAGIEHALLNTGEIGTLGLKADGSNWTAGIQHPRHPDAFIAAAKLDGRFMATSGDYATSFTADHAFNHIFDPATGKSPRSLASVTVVARTGADADALSTAVFVLGPEKGLKLIEATPGADALLVLKDGQIMATRGFPTA